MMKNIWSVLGASVAALAAVIGFMPGSSPAQEHDRGVYIFMDEPLAPYSLGEIGTVCEEGISKRLLEEIFSRLGGEYELHLVPWARALKSAEYGTSDGLPLLMKSEEREAFLVFTDPVIEQRELFYYVRDAHPGFSWNTFADLKGYVIGLINGYTYGEEFLAAVQELNLQVVYAADAEENYRRLLAGRVDLVLDDESTARGLIAGHPDREGHILAAEKPVTCYDWHMGVSRKSPLAGQMDAVNAILSGMRADGTLQAIVEDR